MDCFVGASTGALKGISFQEGVFQNLNSVRDLNPKCDEITSMCWSVENQTQLLTVQMDRQLKLYDSSSNRFSQLFNINGGSGVVKGVFMTKNEGVISATESGDVRMWSKDGEVLKELDAGKDLLVMVPDGENESRCATGGKENPLKVWDLEKGVKTFTAKNVPADQLQLRVPIWDNDVRFINGSQNIVTATGTAELRLYDPRTQRRPVKVMKWLDEPITALSLCNSSDQFIAGNTRGEMGLFDTRHKSFEFWYLIDFCNDQLSVSLVCKFKGFAGSIRGIVAHPQSPFVASCSVDRFVRLHDMNTKALLKKVYCKVSLNRILMKDDISLLKSNGTPVEEMEEYEEDWKGMEELGEESSSGDNSGSEEDEALWNDMKTVRDSEKRKHEEDDGEKKEEGLLKKKKTERLKRRRSTLEEDEEVAIKKSRSKKLKRKFEETVKEEVAV